MPDREPLESSSPESEPLYEDPFADVQAVLSGWSDLQREVALLRLMRRHNNGSEHFDHGVTVREDGGTWGYSWACLACEDHPFRSGVIDHADAPTEVAYAGAPSVNTTEPGNPPTTSAQGAL